METNDDPAEANESPVEKRLSGLFDGQVVISDDFDDPLPDDILNEWEGRYTDESGLCLPKTDTET